MAAASNEANTPISLVELDRYLARWEPFADENPPTQLQLDTMRAQFEAALARMQQTHEWSLAGFNSANRAGREAMKASILINGGAAVALLAFLGHLATVAKQTIAGFTPPLLLYVGGLLFGTIGLGCAYFAQARNAGGDPKGFHKWNNGSIIMTVLAYLAFATAGVLSFFAFRAF